MFNCSSIPKKVWSLGRVPCCESFKVFSSSVPQSQNNKTVNHMYLCCILLTFVCQSSSGYFWNVRPSLESGSLLGELQSLLSPFLSELSSVLLQRLKHREMERKVIFACLLYECFRKRMKTRIRGKFVFNFQNNLLPRCSLWPRCCL